MCFDGFVRRWGVVGLILVAMLDGCGDLVCHLVDPLPVLLCKGCDWSSVA